MLLNCSSKRSRAFPSLATSAEVSTTPWGNLRKPRGTSKKLSGWTLAAGYRHVNLIRSYAALDQFDKARAVAENAFAQKLDAPGVHQLVLRIALMRGDDPAAEKEIQWFSGGNDEYLEPRRAGLQGDRAGAAAQGGGTPDADR